MEMEKALSVSSSATHIYAWISLMGIIVSSMNVVRTLLMRTPNTSQIRAKRWTHWRMASCLLSTRGSKNIDAFLKPLEHR